MNNSCNIIIRAVSSWALVLLLSSCSLHVLPGANTGSNNSNSNNNSNNNTNNLNNPQLTPSWTYPSGLSDSISPVGLSADLPQVAMDNSGNTIIVWLQSDGSNLQIYKSEYRNGAWTHPANLGDYISPHGQDCTAPKVAMDNNGNAIIVWRQFDGASFQVFKSEYRSGLWTNPSSLADNISPDGQDVVDTPSVAMNDNGNAIIVWTQFTGANFHVFKSTYSAGAWTNPANLADNISPNGTDAVNPEVAIDNHDAEIIVWLQDDGSKAQVFKSEYRGGVWTHPANLADNISPNGQNADSPQVAMDDNGDAIIVWPQMDGSKLQTFKSEYRGGVWTHPANLADNISPNGQDVAFPEVVMSDTGRAIIVWSESDGSDAQLFISEYDGSSWVHPSSLSDNISPDGEAVDSFHVAMDSSGDDAIIEWTQGDGANLQLFKSEYMSGIWTYPSGLSDNITPDGQDAAFSAVAMNSSSNVVIVYTQNDGSAFRVYKAEYR